MKKEIPTLKIGTGWLELKIVGEPDVLVTFKGYAPVLPVRLIKNDLEYYLYISAKSISEKLEPMRQNNNGFFSGINIAVRKISEDKFSAYDMKLIP
jgi:hypothetical protein